MLEQSKLLGRSVEESPLIHKQSLPRLQSPLRDSEGNQSDESAQLIGSPKFEFPVWKPDSTILMGNPFNPSSADKGTAWPIQSSMAPADGEWDLASSSPWPSSDVVSEVNSFQTQVIK